MLFDIEQHDIHMPSPPTQTSQNLPCELIMRPNKLALKINPNFFGIVFVSIHIRYYINKNYQKVPDKTFYYLNRNFLITRQLYLYS